MSETMSEWQPDMDKVPGHIAPGIVFCAFGLYGLLKTLKLTRELPPGKTFCQVYLPYKNQKELKIIGQAMMAVTVAGMLYHAAGEGIDANLGLHICLYFTYFMIGLSCFLESQCRLPPDSTRICLAIACSLAGLLWSAHALMMNMPIHRAVHLCEGYINFATAFAFGGSVAFKSSMVLHLACWALLMLQGFWLLTISAYLWFWDIPRHMIEAFMCAEATAVTIFVLLGIAYFAKDIPGQDTWWQGNNMEHLDLQRGNYEVLTKFNENNSSGGRSGDTIESGSSFEEHDEEHGEDMSRVV